VLLLTAEAMRRLDRLTIEGGRANGFELMARAGAGVARALERRYGPALGLRILVLCGAGNNGGDGFVAARELSARGARVRTLLLAPRANVRGAALKHLEALEREWGPVPEVADDSALGREIAALDAWDFALDALLGTGARGEPEGLAAAGVEALRNLDERGTRVVAVDLPTGVEADRGAIARRAVRADLTVTFGAPKRGHWLYPGRAFTGTLEVVDIGLAAPTADDPDYAVELATPDTIAARLAVRDPRAHKHAVGSVLVIGGSAGLTGAVTLAARGATRAGAGLVRTLVPESLRDILAIKLTEEMTLAAPETANRALARAARPVALEHAAAADAVVLGPGLSRDPEAFALAGDLVRELAMPAVVDADALNALAAGAGDGAGARAALTVAAAPRVLTPHLGEMSRLTGIPADQIERDRIDLARRFAREWNCVVVLKGAPTVTAAPDGHATVNPTGNPGMATAGAGDVLSGAIAAFLAGGLPPYDAARLGVYAHGLAGDHCALRIGPIGYSAGSLARALPGALAELARHRDQALERGGASAPNARGPRS